MEQIYQVPLELIDPHPGNRRIGGFDQTKLEQLAESIRAVGVQQPAVVRVSSNVHQDGLQRYELVAGERRWRAARLAGLSALPCVVRALDDVTVLKIHTIENLQREDVHPLDESDGFRRLVDVAGYSADAIAHELGRSPSYVYQRLKLQDLIPEARSLLEAGTITAGHAIQVARLDVDQQKYVMKFLKDPETAEKWGQISVRELGAHIENGILMRLDTASWKASDSALVPDAGACTECPKRTGYQPALFEDIGKDDRCTDRACFARKADVMVELRLKECEGTDVLLLEGDYDPSDVRRNRGAIPQWQWEECKKKDEGAKRGLIVSGLGRGRMLWALDRRQPTRREEEEDEGDSDAYEASRERRTDWDAQREAAEAVRQERLALYRAAVKASVGRELELVGIIGRAICGNDEYPLIDYLYQVEGWEIPQSSGDVWEAAGKDMARRFAEALPADQIRLLFMLTICGDCRVYGHGGQPPPRILYAACDVLGVPHPELAPDPRDDEEDAEEETEGYPVTDDDEEPEEDLA